MTRVRAVIAVVGIGFLAAGGTLYRYWMVPRPETPATEVAGIIAGSPRSIVYDLLKGLQEGDAPMIRQAVYARDADEAQAVDALVEYATAASRLSDAGDAAFGPESLRPLVGLPLSRQLDEQVAHLNEVIDGDMADVDFYTRANPSVFHLRRVAGRWRIMVRETFDPERAEETGPMSGMVQMFRQQATTYGLVAADIEGRRLTTLQEAQFAINKRFSDMYRSIWFRASGGRTQTTAPAQSPVPTPVPTPVPAVDRQ